MKQSPALGIGSVVREAFYGALDAKVSHIIVKDSKMGAILLPGCEITVRTLT